MPSCSVAGCLSYYRKTKGSDIKYFSFPKNEDIAKQWVNACRRKDKINLKHGCVCSLHFAATCFEIPLIQKLLKYENKNSRNLKLDAVPTENLPLGRNKLNDDTERRSKRAKDRSRHMYVMELLNSSSVISDREAETNVNEDCNGDNGNNELDNLRNRIILLEKENNDLRNKYEQLLKNEGELLKQLERANNISERITEMFGHHITILPM